MKFLVLTDIHDVWIDLDKMLRLAGEMDGVIFLGDLMTFRKVTQESFRNLARIKDASNWMVAVPGNGPLPQVREYFNELGINIHCKGRMIEDIGFFGVGGVQDTVKTIAEIREFYRNEDTSGITPDDRAMETLHSFGIHFDSEKIIVEEWDDSKLSEMEIFSSPFEHSEERMHEILTAAIKEVSVASTRIMISHVPPYEPGVVSTFPIGVSTGSKGLSKFITEESPDLSLSGHYHRHHEFMLNRTRCIVIPAAMNGFYGVLTIEPSHQPEASVHAF